MRTPRKWLFARGLGKRVTKEAGASPGALVHVGEPKVERPIMSVITYDAEHLDHQRDVPLDRCIAERDPSRMTWLNVDGLHEVSVVESIGECYGLHPLVQEDILNTGHRPKIEDFETYAYIVLRMLDWDDEAGAVTQEQVSLILGESFVLSFQEQTGDTFDPVRTRLERAKGRIRTRGADYLAYALIDAVVDNYFVVLEKIGEQIEDLEEDLTNDPRPDTLQNLHVLKREVLALRKAVWPLRELVNALLRGESALFAKETLIYLRDVYDHAIEVIETLEAFRDLLAGMMDTYLSVTSNRMNEVMKVLTIIATIFIPITFLAGVYGMNFKHMPELGLSWSYPALWGIMVASACGMLVFFRKKRWL